MFGKFESVSRFKKSSSSAHLAMLMEHLEIPRVERDAYAYWLPRIYEEVYGSRSSYDLCIDGLYDDGALTMNTANKIVVLPGQMEEESQNGESKFFRFRQKKISAVAQSEKARRKQRFESHLD